MGGGKTEQILGGQLLNINTQWEPSPLKHQWRLARATEWGRADELSGTLTLLLVIMREVALTAARRVHGCTSV